MAQDVLDALAGALRAEGGLIAGALAPDGAPAGAPPTHGALAASGPRAAGREDEVALVVEAVREGYLLHYDAPRVVTRADPDLGLLAGDRLYALGLERLAAAGDVASVAALAELIALGAQARAQGDEDRAEAVWTAGAVAVGWGDGTRLAAARAAARAGEASSAALLRAAARHVSANVAPQGTGNGDPAPHLA